MNRRDELREVISKESIELDGRCTIYNKERVVQAILQSEQERLKKRLKKAYWQGFYDCANDRGTFEG